MIILLLLQRKKKVGANPPQTTSPPPLPPDVCQKIREGGERERDWESGLLPEANAKCDNTQCSISQPDGFVRAMYGKVCIHEHARVYTSYLASHNGVTQGYLPTYLS